MPLAPGLYPLELSYERDGESLVVHPVVVETRLGLMLVDAGLPESFGQIETELAEIDRSVEEISRVLVTHQDGDHAGGVRELVKRTGAETIAHLDDAPYIDGRKRPLKAAGPLGDVDDPRYPPAPIDLGLVGGERFRTEAGPAHVVHTPGHTPGHVCLYFPRDKLLVAGDALVLTDGQLEGPWIELTDDLDEAYESLRRLADLDIEQIHCYHGGTLEADEDVIDEVRRKGP